MSDTLRLMYMAHRLEAECNMDRASALTMARLAHEATQYPTAAEVIDLMVAAYEKGVRDAEKDTLNGLLDQARDMLK